jgi:hypothetical protein
MDAINNPDAGRSLLFFVVDQHKITGIRGWNGFGFHGQG